MNNLKIFIAGSRAITNLSTPFVERLNGICTKNHTVLIGDANGVDKSVQAYFSNQNYSNVIVYASNGKARNNIGNWPVESVQVPEGVKGYSFYAAKDQAMADCADYGFMLWNGVSKGTLNNIANLLSRNKKTLVFFAPHSRFYQITCFDKLKMLISCCSNGVQRIYDDQYKESEHLQPQLSLFESTNKDTELGAWDKSP